MATVDFEPSNKYFRYFISFSSEYHSQGFLVIAFFFLSVILLGTFLLLHFFFRRDTTSTHLSTIITAASAQLSSSTVGVPAIALGLDDASINRIPIFVQGSLVARSSAVIDIEREECSICLGIFEDDEMVKVLPECLHSYHSDCVDKWLRNRSSCPLCRSSLDSTVPLNLSTES